MPPTHWLVEDYYDPDPAAPDKTYASAAGSCRPVDFDPLEFGIPPSIVPATDTAQLLALIVAEQVLEDATPGAVRGDGPRARQRASSASPAQELLGTMVSRLQRPVWLKALRESGVPEAEAQAICDRIAKQLRAVAGDLLPRPARQRRRRAHRQPLRPGRHQLRRRRRLRQLAAALSMADQRARSSGQSDLVITGGVDTFNDIFMYMCFSKTPALSPTGDCRPFSDAADGTMLGEGLAWSC